jgi:hypothetical protein
VNYAVAVGQSQVYSVSDGNTWEYGNDLFGLACAGDGCNSNEGMSLAVGDTLRISTTLTSTLILTDSAGGTELFRGFFLRSPHSGTSASSIETSARVTFFDGSGGLMGTYSTVSSMPVWEYEHFSGDASRVGIENLIGDELLSLGQSMEVGGWLYELDVLADPNGLLSTSEWPWVSFGLKADSIQVGSRSPSASVSEPGTLACFALGLFGISLTLRGRRASASAAHC